MVACPSSLVCKGTRKWSDQGRLDFGGTIARGLLMLSPLSTIVYEAVPAVGRQLRL